MKRLFVVLLAVALVTGFYAAAFAQGIDKVAAEDPAPSEVWVDDDFNASTPGWGYDHFAVIQTGINNVSTPGTVHVAEGTYYEHITLKDGIELLGAGSTTTVIDGSHSGTVVTASNVGNTTVLDGFTVTNGTGTGNIFQFSGGGMYNYNAALTIANCIFRDNSIHHQYAALGGGMYNSGSSPTIIDCIFQNNVASASSSYGYGGGMYNGNSLPTITNCVFWDNSANDGGGIYNSGSSPTVTNCILWYDTPYEITGTANVTYSDVQGGYTGDGNLNTDPLFADAWLGNFHLRYYSPCIDAGNNSVLYIPAVDYEGDSRIIDGNEDSTATVDMGADEHMPGPLPTPTPIPPITPTPTPPGGVWVDDDFNSSTPGWGVDHFGKIQDGIDAVSDSVVHVAAGIYYENVVLKDGVQVFGDGSATTVIDGMRNGSVVTATNVGSDTRIDGFTVTNGSGRFVRQCIYGQPCTEDYFGGGMDNVDASPTIVNCFFTNNSATCGGGMYNSGSSPIITDCAFGNNSASECGGGMYNSGSSPTIIDCIFQDNLAIRDVGFFVTFGGGIHSYGSSFTIVNCVFCNNSAAHGGGIANIESSLIITNCTFWNNSAYTIPYGGNGIYNAVSSAVTIDNCILWDNVYYDEIALYESGAPAVTCSDVQGGYAGRGNINTDPLFVNATAGDLRLTSGSPCIDVGRDSAPSIPTVDFEGEPRIIDGNFDGYAIVDMGADEFVPSEVWVDGNFNASTTGWGVDHFDKIQDGMDSVYSVIVHVAEGTYRENVVLKDGVELLGAGSDTTIIDGMQNGSVVMAIAVDNATRFEGFTVTNGSGTYDASWGGPCGGGVFNSESSPVITSCVFRDNAANCGGGMWNNNNSSPYITKCTFRDNSATFGGGMSDGYSSSTITNCIFWNNSASLSAGGLLSIISDTVITNCTFWNNSDSADGAIASVDALPIITNCIFWNDSPHEITNYNTGEPVVTYCDVQGGYSGAGNMNIFPSFANAGAGDFHLNAGSRCIDAGNNSASAVPTVDFEGDPRIWPEGGTVDMGVDERVSSGPAVFEVWVDDDYINGSCGGHSWEIDAFTRIQYGIDNVSVPGTIHVASGTYYENVMLRNGLHLLGEGNTSTVIDGGGIGSAVISMYVDATASIDGFTLTHGTGTLDPVDQRLAGGGMYNYNSSPFVSNCVFEGNTPADGGGMFNMHSSPNISNCYFRNNEAEEDGGGMCNLEGSSPAITNCNFEGNIANKDGGGIFNAPASSSPIIVNCVFWNNSATGLAPTSFDDGKGGGIYNWGASPVITNCDFIGNSAVDGGAIRGYQYAAPILTNCIIWDNSLPQISGYVGQVACSDVQGAYPGGNIDIDPLFVNALAGDFHLSAGSPCIDAGYNLALAIPVTDYEGDPRILSGKVDMGVDEFSHFCGDANGDGEISIMDYSALKLMLLGRMAFVPGGDANGDGELSIMDYSALKLMLLGKRSSENLYEVSCDFSYGAMSDRWARSNSMPATPPTLSDNFGTSPDGWVNASPTDYNKILLTDSNVWTIAGTPGNYSALQCKFSIDVNPDAITSIGVTLNGSAETNGDKLQLWVWDFDAGAWTQIGGNLSMSTDIASYTAWTAWGKVYADYIDDDGYMYILANLNNANQDFNVDYIKLTTVW
jgi:hypothetical protein